MVIHNILENWSQTAKLKAKVYKGVILNNISKMGRRHQNLLKTFKSNCPEKSHIGNLLGEIGLRTCGESIPLEKVERFQKN